MFRDADFLAAVAQNPINVAILERAEGLGVPDWWLTAGALFQTVWNVLDGRAPNAGIRDYDVFYFDASDLSFDAEDAVIRRAAVLFADLDATVELRNEARVHLWYEQRFGVPGVRFRSTTEAIDHFPGHDVLPRGHPGGRRRDGHLCTARVRRPVRDAGASQPDAGTA